MKVHAVCVYNSRDYCAVVCIYKYRSAWAGLTLLILIWGQCKSLNTGISTGGAFSHVFFVSIRFLLISSRQWGMVGQHVMCPEFREFLLYQFYLLTKF